MKLVTHLLGWLGRTAANIVGGLILLVAAVSLAVGLVNGSPSAGLNAGAKVGFAVVHYTTVAAGIVTSYSDDVGPGFSSGRSLGSEQAASLSKAAPAPAPAASPQSEAPQAPQSEAPQTKDTKEKKDAKVKKDDDPYGRTDPKKFTPNPGQR